MKDWKKEFDKYFIYHGEDWRGQHDGGWQKDTEPSEVVDFIETLLQEERERVIKEIIDEVENSNHFDFDKTFKKWVLLWLKNDHLAKKGEKK